MKYIYNYTNTTSPMRLKLISVEIRKKKKERKKRKKNEILAKNADTTQKHNTAVKHWYLHIGGDNDLDRLIEIILMVEL